MFVNNRRRVFDSLSSSLFYLVIEWIIQHRTPSKVFQYPNFYIVMRENSIQTERLYWFCILRYQKRLNEWSIFVAISWSRMKHASLLVWIRLMFSIPITFYHCDCFSIAQNKCPFVLPSDWISNKFAYSCRTHKALLRTRTEKKYDIMCDFYAFINKKQIYISWIRIVFGLWPQNSITWKLYSDNEQMWIVAFRIHTNNNNKKKTEINTFTSKNHQRHRQIIFFDDSEMTLNFLALTCVYAFILILPCLFICFCDHKNMNCFCQTDLSDFHRWCVCVCEILFVLFENIILLCLVSE